MRQYEDQVAVYSCKAGTPETGGRAGCHLEALHPVDGTLDGRIEALHTQARPIDAAMGERLDHLRRKPARVDLDRDLGRRLDQEGMADQSDQVGKRLGRHDSRRSTTEMDVIDLQTTADLLRDQFHFTAQRR